MTDYRDGNKVSWHDFVQADWAPRDWYSREQQAEARILRGDLTKPIETIQIHDMFTSIKPPSVEEQAHEAIVREFDPDYLPRLQRMMDHMRAEMMKAVAIPGDFMQAVTDHKSLATQMEAAIAQEKKR